MKARFHLSYLLILIALSSCVSTHIVRLEMQEPAKVTLPVDIANVLVVNNCVPQPSDVGVERVYKGEREYEMQPLQFDSLSWYIVEVLGAVLDENNFFNEVLICNDNPRTDKEWLANAVLSEDFRRETFEEEDIDGIIAINKVLFTVDQKVNKNGPESDSEVSGYMDLRADVTINCSLYVHDRQSPFVSFPISDSIIYKSSVIWTPQMVFAGIPQYMLQDLSYKAGEMLAYYFIPSWKAEDRLFYAESSSVREAYSYFNNKKWAEAERILIKEYESASKEEKKAKLANNLAVVYEVQDRYDDALAWAKKAAKHISQSNTKNAKDRDYITSYPLQLQKRMTDNRKLDMQYGVD